MERMDIVDKSNDKKTMTLKSPPAHTELPASASTWPVQDMSTISGRWIERCPDARLHLKRTKRERVDIPVLLFAH